MRCGDCGRELARDEMGLSRKLINRNAETCYCLQCLSIRFNAPVNTLLEMIEGFRQAGCTLFF